MRFTDRTEAGRKLAAVLEPRFRGTDAVVLGLPRGGVPVAFEVARALEAPLDVIVVRKLGVPFQPELAMGAIGEDGVRVINDDVVRLAKVSHAEIAATEAAERAELERRAERFRSGRARVPVEGRTVIIVDDGIATGSTAKAACQVARAHGATRVVVAIPVAPPDCQARFAGDADEVICLHQPKDFWAVGQFYMDFTQTSDEEVADLLAAAAARSRAATAPGDPAAVPDDHRGVDEEVAVPADGVELGGHLCLPPGAGGLVVFVHGSGSSRHSPRNRYVAHVLNGGGLGTLLFDLLTPAEEADRTNVFDIDLLAQRLGSVTTWVSEQPQARGLPIGYFGASTGAAAALWAAAEPGSQVAAIVSRGGRPDLAIPRLAEVRAPTLLIVGSRDDIVLELNRRAQSHLRCENRLEVVAGATHLFEEPGTLDQAAALARDWFTSHLATAAPGRTVNR
jgi:putative phosphoribosyl transferase